MATTLLSDVIVPEVFNNYVQETLPEVSALWQSGIIATDPELDEKLEGGGEMVKMPFWKDIDQDDQVRSSDSELSTNNISTGKDIARLQGRANVWGAEDLTDELSGDDPLGAISERVAAYWARRYQDVLIASLEGVFADNSSNDSGDHILDVTISGADSLTEDALISGQNILDAKQLLGDKKGELTAIAMRSELHTRLQKNDLIDYIPDSEQDVGFGTYMNHTVIVDDSLPRDNSSADNAEYEYTSYIFGEGAVGYGEGTPKVPVETERNGTRGETNLIHRRNFLVHPRGVAWQESSVSGDFPTNTELENEANWDRVYEPKNVRLVKLVTNG